MVAGWGRGGTRRETVVPPRQLTDAAGRAARGLSSYQPCPKGGTAGGPVRPHFTASPSSDPLGVAFLRLFWCLSAPRLVLSTVLFLLRLPISMAPSNKYTFGRHAIAATEVFLVTPLVYAMVNWKPVRPGHVLVVTRRAVPRLADATAAEVADLFATARAVGAGMEARAAAAGLTLVVQDGAAAGQTVPHVHVHLIPRHGGDFARNDDVYEAVDAADLACRPAAADGHAGGEQGDGTTAAAAAPAAAVTTKATPRRVDDEDDRQPRSAADMAAEAAELRLLFAHLSGEI